jgi:hypothetical protein
MRIAGRIITALVAAGALGIISAAVVGFVGGGIM